MRFDDDTLKVANYHDVWAPLYDEGYFSKAGLYHAVTLSKLRENLPEDKSIPILDAGGGTGIWTIELANLGYQNITLVDISSGMLEVARNRLVLHNLIDKVQLKMADVKDLSIFANSSFSLIIAQGDVLSYCGDSLKALQELTRVLKPNSKIIFSVEAFFSQVQDMLSLREFGLAENCIKEGQIMRGNPNWATPFRSNVFSPEKCKSLCESAGLAVLELYGKTIFEIDMPIADILNSEHAWLLKYELANNHSLELLSRAKYLEIVAKKPY